MTTVNELDTIDLAGTRAKGARPFYFKDPDIDRVLSVLMALAMEYAVTRQRLDAVERVLAAKNVVARADVDGFVPDQEAEVERTRWTQEYIARLLRLVQQETETLKDGVDVSIESVQELLRK